MAVCGPVTGLQPENPMPTARRGACGFGGRAAGVHDPRRDPGCPVLENRQPGSGKESILGKCAVWAEAQHAGPAGAATLRGPHGGFRWVGTCGVASLLGGDSAGRWQPWRGCISFHRPLGLDRDSLLLRWEPAPHVPAPSRLVGCSGTPALSSLVTRLWAASWS